ncbi:hypothetical protein [Fluviicola sp.]|uniref:hypothetical protein n=1 Tax=Fluviicola sp. TaxID=1917219 RepID=UPI0031DD8896
MHFKILSIAVLSCFLFSCGGNENKETGNDSLKNLPIEKQLEKADLLKGVPFKKLPVVDSTSFDDFEGKTVLSKEIATKLKLKSDDPEHQHFYSRYRVALSDKIDAVVVTLAGEFEMQTFLISYTKEDYKVIDKVVIAYDEIAESAFSSIGKVSKIGIVVTNYNYMDEEPVIETLNYEIEPSGKFVKKH